MSLQAALLADLSSVVASPICWGVLISALGLWGLLPGSSGVFRGIAALIATAGLAVVAVALPRFGFWDQQVLFWLLAATAVMASAAAIASPKPVYTAIWFAFSLLGVAGLFVFLQAQFLGVATIVVYAGAIVVTFLFVLMLAQPEGRTSYDRISWAHFPVPLCVMAAGLLVVLVAWAFSSSSIAPAQRGGGVLGSSDEHMARLGTELFARQLVTVELAGTLLLVALVGAIAIVIHGKPRGRLGAAPSDSGRDDA